MKLELVPDATVEETEITVRYRESNDEVERLIAVLRAADKKLTCTKDGSIYLLQPREILYVETVDKKTFLYAQNEFYESPLRLYEVEGMLGGFGFIRISKSMLVNFGAVRALRPQYGGRLLLTLTNGEELEASRMYAATIKQLIGVN